MATRNLAVGQYGHPMLPGAKHWSFLLRTDQKTTVAYQITGSTTKYEIKAPEVVVPKKSTTFMGAVQVGQIEPDQVNQFWETLKNVPVTHGNRNWNCQNWIIEALAALAANGFAVDVLTKEALADKLAKLSEEDD